ncbi:hypothetical protein WMF18_14750 [Sorangium sp. So ce315]|uniref:hypothetical protein n=1 Tax=Sorangium sp. So ce315 TaxID=3133299 RepID=UPI003F61FCD8
MTTSIEALSQAWWSYVAGVIDERERSIDPAAVGSDLRAALLRGALRDLGVRTGRRYERARGRGTPGEQRGRGGARQSGRPREPIDSCPPENCTLIGSRDVAAKHGSLGRFCCSWNALRRRAVERYLDRMSTRA